MTTALVSTTVPAETAAGLVVRMPKAQQMGILSAELSVACCGMLNGKPAYVVQALGSRRQGWANTTVLGDACEYLDSSQSNMNIPTVGQTLYVVSTSASDTAAGTGARTVRVVYLDASNMEQSVIATMNGTTPVSIGTGYTFIQYAEVMTVGSNSTSVGNVTVSSTNGAATVATTFEMITAGGNKSLSGNYRIPAGKVGYLSSWASSAIGQTMDARLRGDWSIYDRSLTPGVFHFLDRMFVGAGVSSEAGLQYAICPAGGTIKVSAIPGAAASGNRLDCDFHLIVVDL